MHTKQREIYRTIAVVCREPSYLGSVLSSEKQDKLFPLSQWVRKSTGGVLSDGKVESIQLAKQKNCYFVP
jgi:hypothetical protein